FHPPSIEVRHGLAPDCAHRATHFSRQVGSSENSKNKEISDEIDSKFRSLEVVLVACACCLAGPECGERPKHQSSGEVSPAERSPLGQGCPSSRRVFLHDRLGERQYALRGRALRGRQEGCIRYGNSFWRTRAEWQLHLHHRRGDSSRSLAESA